MSTNEDKTEILICECHSSDHQIIIHYAEESGYPTCYMHIHLSSGNFWKRLVKGVKYIFGHKSRYGAWDEFIFSHKDAKKIQELANYLKNEDEN